MPIDISRERVYPLKLLVKLLPPSSRTGKPLHVSCLLRWGKRGLKSNSGNRVYLELIKTGSGWGSSLEKVQLFFDRLSDETNGDRRVRGHSADLPRQRARSIEAAGRELDAARI